jgi:carbon-monoxide dehydrogenase medium subunit
MYDFAYHKPTSLAEAVRLLKADPDAKPLAGGHTLIPALKHRLNRPSALVDLSGIAELRGIRCEGDAVVIGAMTRHVEVATDPFITAAIPALARMAGSIGDVQVRNRGTMGGSLANNDPAADYPAAVLALGGTLVTDAREIPADDFFLGMFTTALQPGELLVAIRLPVPERCGYAKMKNPASRYSMAGVFVAKGPAGVRVAVNGAGPGVFRVAAMEQALAANWSPAAVAGITIPAEGLNSDIHASAEYRAHLVTVMAKRAVIDAG